MIYWPIFLNNLVMAHSLSASVYLLNLRHGLADDRLILTNLTPLGART